MAALTIPNPHSNPKPWDTLELAAAEQEIIWPPETTEDAERFGLVEWGSFESKVKLDKKNKSGAAKGKLSQTGGELIAFTFTIVIVQDDAAVEAAAPILDALRAGAGPFGLKRQPWAAFVKIRDFIVEKVKYNPPSNGVIRVEYSCTEVDADAQAGKSGNATKTPSEKGEEQKAIDEWTARKNAADNFVKAEQARRIIAERAAADAAFDATGVRTAKKLSSVLAGDGEIDINAAQPTERAASSVATGSVNG